MVFFVIICEELWKVIVSQSLEYRKQDDIQDPDREDREKDEDVEVSFVLCNVWLINESLNSSLL